MTAQEIFDKVSKHLLEQNKRSMIGTSCAYRGDNGTMCAVGCLISDDDYDIALEGSSVMDLIEKFSDKFSGFDEHKFLLADLQKTHDVCRPLDWAFYLKQTAHLHGLKFNHIYYEATTNAST